MKGQFLNRVSFLIGKLLYYYGIGIYSINTLDTGCSGIVAIRLFCKSFFCHKHIKTIIYLLKEDGKQKKNGRKRPTQSRVIIAGGSKSY